MKRGKNVRGDFIFQGFFCKERGRDLRKRICEIGCFKKAENSDIEKGKV